MPEAAAVLLGHGAGATPPQALPAPPAAAARHAWVDATMSITLLAPRGAAFDDEAAVRAWARRAWHDLAGPGDDAAAPEPVAWRAGRRRAMVVGVTWPGAELGALAAPFRSIAPLWAGVLAQALARPPADAAWRLVVAEGRALTLIDVEDSVPVRWSTLALARDDAAALVQALPGAAGAVWVAGHSLPGIVPAGVQGVPGLGLPSQAPAALLAALRPHERVEPALRRAPGVSPRLGAALLATAAVVLVVAGWSAWDTRQALLAAQARADARDRVAEAARREQRGRFAQQAAAWQRLQQPWALRWAAAEAAQPAGGGWLRLEQRRDAPRLLLVGEAETPAAALAVARGIAAQPGVAEAVLLRSEAAAGQRARFELGVRLAEGRP